MGASLLVLRRGEKPRPMASNVRFVKIRSSEIYTMIHFESLYIHKPPILCKTRVYTSYKEDNNMLRCSRLLFVRG